MSALVKLADVSKRYADAIALHATNLSIERGKTTILIGPSGCGKSTLLRLIIRLIEPDSGSIEFNGEPITPDTIGALRRRIGYVIQEGGLFPHLTARAAFDRTRQRSVNGTPHREIRERNAEQTRRFVRSDEILHHVALAISCRTFGRPTTTRRLDAGVNAFAGAVVAR